MFVKKAVLIFLIIAWPWISIQARNLNCSEAQFFKNRGISVSDLVKKSDTIVYATAKKFVTDSSDSRFSGYYIFSPNFEIKGQHRSYYKVKGDKPYTEIPQHYIDITEAHKQLNLDSLYSDGSMNIVEEKNGGCYLLPKFKVGWNYLILLGSESELSYEPINSAALDYWLKAIEAEVLKK